MTTKIEPATNTIFLINASGGEPDKPAPDSGEVIQLPQVVTPQGKAALAALGPGQQIVTVWSRQTAKELRDRTVPELFLCPAGYARMQVVTAVCGALDE
jgi:hypothetical protein